MSYALRILQINPAKPWGIGSTPPVVQDIISVTGANQIEFCLGFVAGHIASNKNPAIEIETMTPHMNTWGDGIFMMRPEYMACKSDVMDWTCTNYVKPGYFGWWLKSTPDKKKKYNLVTFKTIRFVNGFIEACKMNKADFRNYIVGPPFLASMQQPITYEYFSVIGYDIAIPQQYEQQATLEPFYGDVKEGGEPYDYE
jgi:hypothetical protein